MAGLRFDWDAAKARVNLRKHGVSFEEARTVFFDEHALFLDDPEHLEDEERFLLLGLSIRLRTLVVCQCLRDQEDRIRIISARRANRNEQAEYKRRLPR
jgi:uncharacterized protein